MVLARAGFAGTTGGVVTFCLGAIGFGAGTAPGLGATGLGAGTALGFDVAGFDFGFDFDFDPAVARFDFATRAA